MSKSYRVTLEKAYEIFEQIVASKRDGGYGGTYTEREGCAVSDSISAYYDFGGSDTKKGTLHVCSIFSLKDVEHNLKLS